MNDKIQLLHPQGKHAVRIDRKKYEVIKAAIVKSLEKKPGLTHTALLDSVAGILSKNKTTFEGSVGWHLEWVKLDLEANKLIERVTGKPMHEWKLSHRGFHE